MRKVWLQSDIIRQYIESGNIMYMATLSGDYKKNNEEGKKLTELYKYLEKNLELANDTLPLLFEDKNIVTRTKAAAHCLALKIQINNAIKVIEDAANNKTDIFGFNAEMTLKVWHEKGHLKVY